MSTRTYAFGVSRREGHDASSFYGRRLFSSTGLAEAFRFALDLAHEVTGRDRAVAPGQAPTVPPLPPDAWADRIYCHSSEEMPEIPDGSVALAFTSPPYNSGKAYDADLDVREYLRLLARVGAEVMRVLRPGGRYVINIANLGRKPYVPLHAYLYALHAALGFLPMGEVIWRKGRGASGNCAWGSWCSPRAPRLRDVHEYLLVFARARFDRPERGPSDTTPEEFMEATLSVWELPPESARRVGHPAPFPEALAARVVRLYSYVGDVVLDPFCGSGTTCVAARLIGRRYVGYDIEPQYCALAEKRLAADAACRPQAPGLEYSRKHFRRT